MNNLERNLKNAASLTESSCALHLQSDIVSGWNGQLSRKTLKFGKEDFHGTYTLGQMKLRSWKNFVQ